MAKNDEDDDADVDFFQSDSDTHANASNVCGDWSRCCFVSVQTEESSVEKSETSKDPGAGWYFSGALSYQNIRNICQQDLPSVNQKETNSQALERQLDQCKYFDAVLVVVEMLEVLKVSFGLPDATADDFRGIFFKVMYDRSRNDASSASCDSEVFHSSAHYRSRKTANRSMYGFRGNGSLRSCYAEVKPDPEDSTSNWAGNILFYFVVTHPTSGRRLAFARVRWFDVPATKSEAKSLAAKLVGGQEALRRLHSTTKKQFPECPSFRYKYSGGLPFRIGQGNVNLQFLGHRSHADDWIDVGALVSKLCVAPLATKVAGKDLSSVPDSTGNCIFAFWQQQDFYSFLSN